MKIQDFGITKKGEEAKLYTIKSDMIECRVTDYGTTLVNLFVPDKSGKMTDVVLGYGDVRGYEQDCSNFGANVGRNANRIGNAEFTLNGEKYTLDKNDGKNNLHSGCNSYSKRMWSVDLYEENKIAFSLESPHMNQGLPGKVKIHLQYEICGNTLKISYGAIPEEDTILNLTNHSYFNLNEQGKGNILQHTVKMDADKFTPTDAELIPTGLIADVCNTPMDFQKEKTIGEGIDADYEPLKLAGGYDHNFCVREYDGSVKSVVEVTGDVSGICMRIATDYPGIQFYTGNFLEYVEGKDGAVYRKREGFCFEPQYFPDAVNKENFITSVCKAGERYSKNIEYIF